MMITKIYSSPLKTKRFRAEVQTKDGLLKIDFGLRGASTFIDGQSEIVRQNYLKRHLGSPIEKRLITTLTPSPSLLSAKLLWGDSHDINTNIRQLNKLWGN